MRHGSLGVMAVCAGLSLAAACGGDDDAGLNGTGGASTGGASSGGASSGGSSGATSGGGTSSGGTAGTPSGGSAGADASAGGSSSGGTGGASTGGTSSGGTGGTGGANTGGTSSGGASTGGTGGTSAGGTGGSSSGGTGGGNTGGTGGGTSVGCPSTAPAPGTTCNVAGAVCCYGAAPAKPVRCVPTTLDGGGPYEWATLQSKVCCPSNPPTVGTTCDVPGDMKCCYASSAFRCDNQPNPDVWATTTCN